MVDLQVGRKGTNCEKGMSARINMTDDLELVSYLIVSTSSVLAVVWVCHGETEAESTARLTRLYTCMFGSLLD